MVTTRCPGHGADPGFKVEYKKRWILIAITNVKIESIDDNDKPRHLKPALGWCSKFGL